MGYYTIFTMEGMLNATPKQEEEIAKEIALSLGYSREEIESIESLDCDFLFREELKWYSFQSDMVNISKKFPDVGFILAGAGEESLDFWKLYVRDGYCEYAPCSLVYPEPSDRLGFKFLE